MIIKQINNSDKYETQQGKIIQFMLQNIIRLSQQKSFYLRNKDKAAVIRKLRNSQVQFQIEALSLIQYQVKCTNAIIMTNSISNFCHALNKFAWTKMKECQSGKIQKMAYQSQKLSYFGALIRNIIQKNDNFHYRNCFNLIKKVKEKKKKIELIFVVITKCQIRRAFNNIVQHSSPCRGQVLEQLDISQIELNQTSDIQQSFTQFSHCQQYIKEDQVLKEESESQKIERLKKQMKQIQYEIENYKQFQQLQIERLKSKMNKNKGIKNEESSCQGLQRDESPYSGIKMNETLISKLIRSNFELEEKLQQIYDLLSMVKIAHPDITKRLLRIAKKKSFNIQLQKNDCF